MILWEDEPCTITHIGQRTMLNTNTLTPLLKRLEKQNVIERTRDKNDERSVVASLTPEGRTLQRDLSGIPHELLTLIGGSETDAIQLKSILDALIAKLAGIESTRNSVEV